jgi:uncharacterized membrane-anchored protein YhcB (DUF1043 family)
MNVLISLIIGFIGGFIIGFFVLKNNPKLLNLKKLSQDQLQKLKEKLNEAIK